uniref:VWFC domain-containing protein n=1 Tax=Anopheles coluzzii TaxID=1518534 RepID=A0A8W7P4A5_ANOCL
MDSTDNGFVECEQESCPAVDDCYIYKKKGPDECCDKCIGCLYQGRHIDSGTEWTDPDDPCMHYKCVSGVVTRSEMKCYAPCSDPSPPRKGQCCPTCLGELQKFPVRTSYFRSVCVCVRSRPRRSGAFVPAGWSSVRSLSRRLPKCTGKMRRGGGLRGCSVGVITLID